jgi:hypothetical protein
MEILTLKQLRNMDSKFDDNKFISVAEIKKEIDEGVKNGMTYNYIRTYIINDIMHQILKESEEK